MSLIKINIRDINIILLTICIVLIAACFYIKYQIYILNNINAVLFNKYNIANEETHKLQLIIANRKEEIILLKQISFSQWFNFK
jgi:hypothetical protein